MAVKRVRHERILTEVRQHKMMSVHDIMTLFGCSISTARRDLDALAAQGHIVRSWGGAQARDGGSADDGLLADGRGNGVADPLAAAKERIARAAAALVADGATIGLGGGTTTLEVVRALRGHNITIVTNALDLVNDLVPVPGARVVVLAGELLASGRELVGPLIEETLSRIYMDTLFLSVNGLSAESGAAIMSYLEAQAYRAMAARAGQVVVVADQSKIGRAGLTGTFPITDVDILVTDAAASHQALEAIGEAGVHVIAV